MALLSPRRGIVELHPKRKKKPLPGLLRKPQGYPSLQSSNYVVQLNDEVVSKIARRVAEQLAALLPIVSFNSLGQPSIRPEVSKIEIDTSVIDVGIEEKETKEGKYARQIKENKSTIEDITLKKSKGRLKEALSGRKR